MNAITRVELHGQPETSAQYQDVHKVLADVGLSRTITNGATNKLQHLPHATYYSSRYDTVRDAHTAAVNALAAIRTTRGHGVVTSGAEVWLDGLMDVK
jgi:hypothetical protein